MLYSRERHSLSDHAADGSRKHSCATQRRLSRRHNFQGVKDTNESSMDRGTLSILRTYRVAVRVLPLALLFACFAGDLFHRGEGAVCEQRGPNAGRVQSCMKTTTPRTRHTGRRTRRNRRTCAIQADFERMRFQAAVAHVDRGRVLKQSGDLQGAMAEFTRALQIDQREPGSEAGNRSVDHCGCRAAPGRRRRADGRTE